MDTKLLMRLRKLLRGKEQEIELTLESNLNGMIYFRNNDFNFELKNKGDITFITLAEAKQIPKAYFEKKWINIIDTYTDDEALLTNLTLKDVYVYLQIDSYYNFTDKDTVQLATEEDYKEIINTLTNAELAEFLQELDKTTKRELQETVVKMYREDTLTDRKKLNTLEKYLTNLYFEDIE